MTLLKWHDHVPYSTHFDDIYFSHNSLEEREHVFIKGNHLLNRWRSSQLWPFKIGEMGFGTGLNWTLTLKHWIETKDKDFLGTLHFISVEAYPLTLEDLDKVYSFFPSLLPFFHLWRELYNDSPETITLSLPKEKASLTLIKKKAAEGIEEFPTSINAWYLDGFSPSKNPDLWSEDLLKKIYNKTALFGTGATYSVAQKVREHLTQALFSWQKEKGVGRKKEILTFNRPSD